MRIIISAKERESLNKEKEVARAGCNVCPTCGWNRMTVPGILGGVNELHSKRTIFEKNGKRIIGRVDRFECMRCGTIWESDPYEDIYSRGRET